jgi:WD40 repeat protein
MAATPSNFDDDDEPFGITAIPEGYLSLTFDESKLEQSFFGSNSANGVVVAQQPQTQAFATYEASKNESLDPLITLNGSLIDVNPHFVVYALKNGLIRVLHRHSAMRALLRGHSNQVVTDITFFHDGDTLATVGNDNKGSGQKSTLIVWRVYENPPEIGSAGRRI